MTSPLPPHPTVRLAPLLAMGLAAVAFGSAVACSVPAPVRQDLIQEDTADDEEEDPPVVKKTKKADAAVLAQEPVDDGGACSLSREGLGFRQGTACETCMQENCCAETVACFKDNKDCSDLNTCVTKCGPVDRDAAVIPEGGVKDGGFTTGNACVDACYKDHPPSVDAQRAFGGCYETKCKVECKATRENASRPAAPHEYGSIHRSPSLAEGRSRRS
ncbi:MAG: hypothetical protein U0169_05595 [Polyangiaceae bacterium]